MQRIKTKPVAMLLAVLAVLSLCMGAALADTGTAPDDTAKPCTLTISLAEGVRRLADTEFSVQIFRFAEMDENANLTLLEDYQSITEDLSRLKGPDSPEKTALLAKLPELLLAVIQEKSITGQGCTVADGKAELKNLETGLYLIVPEELVITEGASYTMQPLIISLPNGSPTEEGYWQYDVEVFLKAEVDESGSAVIEKKLISCNVSLGGADAVFRVKGMLGDRIVYRDVISLHFDGPGTQKYEIKNLPKGTVLTVEEVYSGGAYRPANGDSTLKTSDPVPSDREVELHLKNPVELSFENEYDETLVQSTSVVNHFYDYDKIYKWVSLPDSQNEPNA